MTKEGLLGMNMIRDVGKREERNLDGKSGKITRVSVPESHLFLSPIPVQCAHHVNGRRIIIVYQRPLILKKPYMVERKRNEAIGTKKRDGTDIARLNVPKNGRKIGNANVIEDSKERKEMRNGDLVQEQGSLLTQVLVRQILQYLCHLLQGTPQLLVIQHHHHHGHRLQLVMRPQPQRTV